MMRTEEKKNSVLTALQQLNIASIVGPPASNLTPTTYLLEKPESDLNICVDASKAFP